MPLRSIQVVVSSRGLLLFIAEWHSVVWMYHSFFIHSSIEEHLSCFHFGAVMNKATYKHSCTGFCVTVSFDFSGSVPRREIVGLYGRCMFNYKKLPNCFPEWQYHFVFLWVMSKSSSCSVSSSPCGIV